jgi:hypothetical protein
VYESGEAGLWGIERRRGPKCYEGSKSTKQPRYVMVEFMFVGVTNVGSSVYPVVYMSGKRLIYTDLQKLIIVSQSILYSPRDSGN